MKFIDKERNILIKLQQTNYEMFDGNASDAFDFVAAQLEKFPAYTNIVIREQIMQPIWYARFEGENLRDHIQSMDERRKMAHDGAIKSIDILNRLSKNLGLEPFADVDTKDRHAVAELVGQYVSEVYNNGINKSFDDMTYQKEKEYDTKVIPKRLQKAVPEVHLDQNYDDTGLTL